MSKIFDALRKSEGVRKLEVTPSPETARMPAIEPEPVRPAEIDVNPSGLDLPLEFTRELGTLRATIEQLLPGRQQRTVLLAGAVEGEGSSTIACAFARLLAEDDRLRVALVDADLRGVRRRLPTLDQENGFPGVLAGQCGAEQALIGTTLPNLVILPGAISAESPLRLCTPENCRTALDYLRRHFHYVIIDGAPLLEAPEMMALAAQVDGTMLVVRASRTKREVVQRALETVEKFHGHVLGAILNRQQYVIPEFIYRRI